MPDAGRRDRPEGLGSPLGRLRQLAEDTPAHRDRYVDLLRAVAILTVVVGHWVTSAVTVTDGRLGGVNALYVVPWAQWATWLFQVMPVFFLVGGYANTASLDEHRRSGGTATAWVQSRALRLLRPTAVFVVVLVVGYAAALALGADARVARTSVWLAGIALWFLVVYLAVVALAPTCIDWQRRWGAGAILTLVALVAAGDVARVVTGSDVPATGSYVVGWLAVHQLGVAWRDGVLTRTRRPASVLAGGGLGTAAVLVAWGPYGVTMVGAAPPPDLGNADPPTLALLALAASQTGVVLLLSPVITPWLERLRVWMVVVALNAVILTIFLWHMVPVVIAGVTLMGSGLFPQPEVGSGEWFALRVPWLLVLAVLLTLLVAVLARFETSTGRRREGTAHPVAVGAGVVACVAALAGLGVTGTEGVLPPVAGLPVGELVLFGTGLTVLARADGSRPWPRRDPSRRGG
ncbi:acyltransferase [Actinotalea sp. K2]|uniref:acyltransferase family protein n=1 Tax=Actinotalea sp. K2 TaxID=2939438 RepID=UPI002016DDC0|nr:acyltransferase [Actinotalea sp. K2]MCL3861221.1 acyltransferase [Actinotalea sp. K2]